MRSLLVFCVAVVTLDGLAFAHAGAPVEARGEWGQAPNGEFWNGYATRFIHAPAFGFKAADGVAKYRYEVTDDWHRVHMFEAPTPNASLASVWGKLPVGYVIEMGTVPQCNVG